MKNKLTIKKIYMNNESEEILNNEFENFLSELERFHIGFLDEVENNRTIENELHRSPMTVFDGKWGSGKTHFISKFIKKFERNEFDKNDYFDDVVYIDALSIVDDENIIQEFLYELWKDNQKAIDIISQNVKNGIKKTINSLITVVNAAKNTGFKNIEIKTDKDKFKDNVVVNKKTIVFIDNLERIGNDSNIIIRLLHKLRVIDNLFFVLITNLNYLNYVFNDNNSQFPKYNSDLDQTHGRDEYPLYKFINTPIFSFSQDYISLIKEMYSEDSYINENEIQLISKVIEEYDLNEQPSIRRVKNWFLEKNYNSLPIENRQSLLCGLNQNSFEKNYRISFSNEILNHKESLQSIYLDIDELIEYYKYGEIDIDNSENEFAIRNGCLYSNRLGYILDESEYNFTIKYNESLDELQPFDIATEEFNQDLSYDISDVIEMCNGFGIKNIYNPVKEYLNLNDVKFNSDFNKQILSLKAQNSLNDILEKLNAIIEYERINLENADNLYLWFEERIYELSRQLSHLIEKIEIKLTSLEGYNNKSSINSYTIEHQNVEKEIKKLQKQQEKISKAKLVPIENLLEEKVKKVKSKIIELNNNHNNWFMFNPNTKIDPALFNKSDKFFLDFFISKKLDSLIDK